MAKSVAAEINKLEKASRRELLDAWARLYGRPAPQGFRRELLVPFLAYRLQENRYGGLRPSTLSTLRQIAGNLEKSKGTKLTTRPKPGTRIVREWRGQTHEVLVTESGYEYRANTYRSLSELARKITGTRWSGPGFFGVKRTGHARE